MDHTTQAVTGKLSGRESFRFLEADPSELIRVEECLSFSGVPRFFVCKIGPSSFLSDVVLGGRYKVSWKFGIPMTDFFIVSSEMPGSSVMVARRMSRTLQGHKDWSERMASDSVRYPYPGDWSRAKRWAEKNSSTWSSCMEIDGTRRDHPRAVLLWFEKAKDRDAARNFLRSTSI